MAAVALANIPLYVVQLFIFGVQSGATVLLSQYWGKQDMGAINRVMGVSIWIAVSITGPVCRHIAGVSHPLFKPVRQPGGGHCAGRPIRQAGRAVLCFFSTDHDVCHGLSQHGAPSAGPVHPDGIHDAEHLLELGVYLRQFGRARLGSAWCGPGHPHRQKCGTGHRDGASAYDKILPGAARSGAAARPWIWSDGLSAMAARWCATRPCGDWAPLCSPR